MESLEFTIPDKPARPDETVTVTLAGEDMVFHRPKDATLFFASNLAADEVSMADRAMAIVQFINGSVDGDAHQRFYERVCDRDDPMGQQSVLDALRQLMERWNDGDTPKTRRPKTLTVDSGDGPVFYGDEDIRVQIGAVDLDFVASPPKDLAMMIVASSLATGAGTGQQAWSVSMFLDAACSPETRLNISMRLRDRSDPLDLEHIADIVLELLRKWAPEGLAVPEVATLNRAQRRANGQGGTAKAQQTSGKKPANSTSRAKTTQKAR